jgi:hypothetical protein
MIENQFWWIQYRWLIIEKIIAAKIEYSGVNLDWKANIRFLKEYEITDQ